MAAALENIYTAIRAALLDQDGIYNLAEERVYADHGVPPAGDSLQAQVVFGLISDSLTETGLHFMRFQIDYYAPAAGAWDAWAMANAGAAALHSKTLTIDGWTCFWINQASRQAHGTDEQGVYRIQDDYEVKVRPTGA